MISEKIKRIFKSELLAQQFCTNGYLVLPFLSENELKELSDLFDKYKPRTGEYSIYSNLEDNTYATNVLIENKIRELFQPSIDKYFHHYKFFGGSYLVKGLGEESATELHQDWNAVDEKKDISLTIWVPTVDVDENNGCLQVIPGSHLRFSTIRSANIPSLYLKFDSRVERKTVSLPVKAGMAVLFAFNLFHGSKANKTNLIRKAVHLAMVNEEAEIVHYVRDKDHHSVLKVSCDRELLYSQIFNILKGNIPPDLNTLETIPDSGDFTINEKIFFEQIN